METSKQKFEKEALGQMKRLKEIKNVITRVGNKRHIYVYSPLVSGSHITSPICLKKQGFHSPKSVALCLSLCLG